MLHLRQNTCTTSGLYYKNIMIIRMTIVSDATSCGVTYNHHSDNIYATRVANYIPGGCTIKLFTAVINGFL